jgi:very-short-patch-repair endonuclease
MTGIDPTTRQRARELRAAMTPQERRLWAKLRELNRMLGLNFRRQAPIGPFIADFADLGRRLVIEVDGSGHGGARDQRRDDWLGVQGFTVLRAWNSDVNDNLEGAVQAVLDLVTEAPPPPPSPTRGEGGAKRPALRGSVDLGTSPPPGGEGMGVGGAACKEERP